MCALGKMPTNTNTLDSFRNLQIQHCARSAFTHDIINSHGARNDAQKGDDGGSYDHFCSVSHQNKAKKREYTKSSVRAKAKDVFDVAKGLL